MIDWNQEWAKIQDRGKVLDRGRVMERVTDKTQNIISDIVTVPPLINIHGTWRVWYQLKGGVEELNLFMSIFIMFDPNPKYLSSDSVVALVQTIRNRRGGFNNEDVLQWLDEDRFPNFEDEDPYLNNRKDLSIQDTQQHQAIGCQVGTIDMLTSSDSVIRDTDKYTHIDVSLDEVNPCYAGNKFTDTIWEEDADVGNRPRDISRKEPDAGVKRFLRSQNSGYGSEAYLGQHCKQIEGGYYTSAELFDIPTLPFENIDQTKNSYQAFEVAPVLFKKSSPSSGKYLGSLNWGWICDNQQKFQALKVILNTNPSNTFRKVVNVWNNYRNEKQVTDKVSHNRLKLPDFKK